MACKHSWTFIGRREETRGGITYVIKTYSCIHCHETVYHEEQK